MIKKRLIRLLSDKRKYVGYQVLWQWFTLITQIVIVFAISKLISDIRINRVSMGYLFVLPVAAVVRYFCDRRVTKASYQACCEVKKLLRNKIYEKLLRLGISYREQVSTAEVVQMSTEGVEQLETYFGKYLSQLFYSLLAPITLFFVLSFVSIRAAVVLLICVPLIPLSIVAVQKIAKKLLSRYWGMYTSLGDSFLENLQGLTTLKIYQADEKKAREMDKESQQFRRITMKVLTMQLNSTSVMDIVAYGGTAVGIMVAIREFTSGRIDLSGIVVIILLAAEFFLPLRLLGSYFHIAMNGMAASDNIFHLLDLPEPEHGDQRIDERSLDISLTGVDFSYDKERQILSQLNMRFPSRGLVSIVGESGCGKSTVAGILTGHNRNYSGEVLVGGIPQSVISEESLMGHMTLVTHQSYLFKGTVEENLRIAKSNVTREEMFDALKSVNLNEYLQTQQGLETRLSEQGGNMSGGQRQRLALARALLHDTPIYIFDEATSNIDAESEEMIMKVISRLAMKKMVILISHRLANVIGSDRIYMMKHGQVVEYGTHDELLKKEGNYSQLYASQKELEEYVYRNSKSEMESGKNDGQ